MLNNTVSFRRFRLIVVAVLAILTIWGCSFLGDKDEGQYITVKFNLQKDLGTFQGMGANVPISFYNRRMKPLQTFHEIGVKYIRVKRESDNWDNILALRSAGGRLGIKWIYTLDAIPGSFLNEHGQLNDVKGFAGWWAEEVDELYYQEVPADYIELLEKPDIARGDSIPMSSDVYTALIHATREELDLRNFEHVGIVGPGLSTVETGGTLETWYMDLDQTAYDALDYWTVQLLADTSEKQNCEESLRRFTKYLDNIESRKPIFISSYSSSQYTYPGLNYPDPNNYDVKGNLNSFETYYYSATFSMPYGVRVYSNTLDLLKQGQVTPFINQMYDAPADVKFKKQSWGLLDLNGVPKPVFTLLSNLMKRVPKKAAVVTGQYDSTPGLNALGFKSSEKVLITLANQSLEPRSIQIQLNGAKRPIELSQAVKLIAPEIKPVELGQRDVVEIQESELKLRYDSTADIYTVVVQLDPQSTFVADFQVN